MREEVPLPMWVLQSQKELCMAGPSVQAGYCLKNKSRTAEIKGQVQKQPRISSGLSIVLPESHPGPRFVHYLQIPSDLQERYLNTPFTWEQNKSLLKEPTLPRSRTLDKGKAL